MNAVSSVTHLLYGRLEQPSLSRSLMGRNLLPPKNPTNENLEEDPIWREHRKLYVF